MVAGVESEILEVETENLASFAPWATVTAAGTLAADGSLLVSETLAPPDGAAAESPTFPVRDVPPATLEALSDREASEDDDEGGGAGLAAGATLSEADSLASKDLAQARMLTPCELETG